VRACVERANREIFKLWWGCFAPRCGFGSGTCFHQFPHYILMAVPCGECERRGSVLVCLVQLCTGLNQRLHDF